MSSVQTAPANPRTFKLRHRLSRDTAPHLARCLADLSRGTAYTALAKALAWWWGIEAEPGCQYFGLPIFRRHPGSHIRIGANCQFRSAYWSNLAGINRPCMLSTLSSRSSIEIGEGSGLSGTVIGSVERVVLGRRVMCGANVMISDTDWHPVDPVTRAAGLAATGKPVLIGDDVWLGMNVMVLKGVSIGARTVVGAGSVVSTSLPSGVIAVGQPARPIQKIAAV
jgi:acetyltransferase-like isoleucine patch superfamily enzyme